MEQRIQKVIAESGLCSRRAAERLLEKGRVTVNGRRATLGEKADPQRDEIAVDGTLLGKAKEKTYLMLNKPRGYLSSLSDPHHRKTIVQLVEDCGVRVFPVGRLDLDSDGLLLMTNDGALMQRLTHPKNEINKTYFVTVSGPVSGAADRLAGVTELEGECISSAQVLTLEEKHDWAILSVTIHEGKNRQIRRMCERCGLKVLRLQRVAEHDLLLGDLPEGQWRYLTAQEILQLKSV